VYLNGTHPRFLNSELSEIRPSREGMGVRKEGMLAKKLSIK